VLLDLSIGAHKKSRNRQRPLGSGRSDARTKRRGKKTADGQPETADAEIRLRIRSSVNCKYFREVRQSALDTLIDLPPLHNNQKIKRASLTDPARIRVFNLLFVALLVKLKHYSYVGFWRDLPFFLLIAILFRVSLISDIKLINNVAQKRHQNRAIFLPTQTTNV